MTSVETTISEAELLRRVVQRDRTAFADLYDRFSGQTYGVLTKILGRGGQAEEVLQDVFLEVWQSAPRYDPARGTPRQWILMMARSRALDRLRSTTSSTRREEKVSTEMPVVTEPIGTRGLEDEERRLELRRALLQLPDEQRQCIELAFFRGMTQTQVAREIDAPLGTVKSRILLGMRKMRLALSPTEASEGGQPS